MIWDIATGTPPTEHFDRDSAANRTQKICFLGWSQLRRRADAARPDTIGAREQGLTEIPAATADPLILEFRRVVRAQGPGKVMKLGRDLRCHNCRDCARRV